MTPPKSCRPDFGAFQAPEAPESDVLDRATLRGLSVDETVGRIMAFYAAQRDLRDVTRRQKVMVLGIMLRDFEKRGKQLTDLQATDVANYRAFLNELTRLPAEEGGISRNYAAHLVKQWNSAMCLVFGDQSKPGNGLKMRGFKQTPKDVDHLTQEDVDGIADAARRMHFKTEAHRVAFTAYVEVAWCAGPRVGSLLTPATTVASIGWADSVLHLGHMKNTEDGHKIVLTDRTVRALRNLVEALQQSKVWRGRDTPLFLGPDGRMMTMQWLNRALKRAAATAGVRKNVTTHVFRHSTGTLIGLENPKLAMMQLGVTEKVFQRHYNKPTLKDRLTRRDVLPGSTGVAQTPMEKLGSTFWKFEHGMIDRSELDNVLELTRLAERTNKKRTSDEFAYV